LLTQQDRMAGGRGVFAPGWTDEEEQAEE
jgi:hypothetical protein